MKSRNLFFQSREHYNHQGQDLSPSLSLLILRPESNRDSHRPFDWLGYSGGPGAGAASGRMSQGLLQHAISISSGSRLTFPVSLGWRQEAVAAVQPLTGG
jgi:hypothetical protein